MGTLGRLSAKLDAATHTRALRRYRRRVAGELSSVPVPIETVVANGRGTLVLGPPGAGKTTLLRYLHWSSCAGVTAYVGKRLTVEVPLGRVERLDDVTGAIAESLERHGLSSASDFVRRELSRPVPSLMILFDGLDEVGRDERSRVARAVAGFAARYPSVWVVVKRRTQAYDGALDEGVDQTVHLRPLSDEQVAQFLRARPATTEHTAPRTVDWLVSALQDTPWLASLARNPLVLAKLADLHSTTYGGSVRDLLHDRRRVCQEVADLLLARWKPEHNRERPEVKKAVLQHLAADGLGVEADPRGMRYEDVLAEVRLVLPRYDRAPGKAAEVLDEIVERSGLLVRLEGGERYQFADRAMQQYFAALALDHRPDEVLRRYRVDRETWRGVLELSCAGDHDATGVIGRLAEEGDTAAALTCLTDATQVDSSVGDRVIEASKAALMGNSADLEVVRSWGHFVSAPRPRGRAGFDFLASRAGAPGAAAALALSRLPEAADVLATWAAQDEKVLPHLERMGSLAVPALAGLAARGSLAAAQSLDRIVNTGRGSAVPGSPPVPPTPHGPPGPPARIRPPGRKRAVTAAITAAAVACVLVVAVVVVRDGSGGDPAASDEPRRVPPGDSMELVWSTPSTHVASKPVLVGGNVVAYVVDGDGLALVGYDPASGSEVWRRPSTASQIPTGVVLSVVSDGERVFHISPGQGNSAAIEAVDGAAGDRLWRTEPASGGFGDPVDFCTDDSLCVSALSAGGPYQRWTIDAQTGRAAGVAAFTPPQAEPIEGRSLGFGLVDLYPSRDIARVVDGQVVWRRSPSELFGGHDVSPDYGWSWRATGDLLVGSLGAAVDVPEFGSAETVPQYTAGIDAATGATRWVTEGDPACGERLNELGLRVNGTAPWLRCRITGTLEWEDNLVTGADVDAVMEGFDPTTGEATWTAELEGASGLYVDTQPLVRFGRASFALTLDEGSRLSLDVATGQTIDVDADTLGWCFSDNTYRQAEGPDPRRLGPDFTTPCTVAGEPQTTPAEPDEAIGVEADGIFVWMDADGLHGARLRG